MIHRRSDLSSRKKTEMKGAIDTEGREGPQSNSAVDVQSYVEQSAEDRKLARELILSGSRKESSTGSGRPSRGELLQPGISAKTLMHLSHIAKESGGLDSYHKMTLYSMGKYLRRFGGLTKKQIGLMDKLLADAKSVEPKKLSCAEPDCPECREFREYLPGKHKS